jgi:hypothetical protein
MSIVPKQFKQSEQPLKAAAVAAAVAVREENVYARTFEANTESVIMDLAAKNVNVGIYLRDLMNTKNPAQRIEDEYKSFETDMVKTPAETERLYYWILFERLGIKLDETRQLNAVIATQRRHLVWSVCSEVLSSSCANIADILPWFRFLMSMPRKITMKTLSRVLTVWQIMRMMKRHDDISDRWMSAHTNEQRLVEYESLALCDG